jgi:hypothetical protein
MPDPVSIFQKIVKKNSVSKNTDYRFPLLDSQVNRKKPYILDIVGDNDSLKTRLGLYLANSLMFNGHPVYWVSASDYNQRLTDIEIEYPDRMMVLFDSDLYRIIQFLRCIPENSDVFIDSIISIHSTSEEVMKRPYLTFGKLCHEISEQRNLRVHIISPISGISFKPLTDVFDRKIHHRISIKKIKSYKDFVGMNYQVVGNYYLVSSKNTKQLLPASLFSRIDPKAALFFWLVAQGIIKKKKRTYYDGEYNLGSQYQKIIQNDELLNRLYNRN